MVFQESAGLANILKQRFPFLTGITVLEGEKDKPSSKHKVMLQLVFKGQQIISPLKISRPSDTQDCNTYQNVFKVDIWFCHKDKYNSCF